MVYDAFNQMIEFVQDLIFKTPVHYLILQGILFVTVIIFIRKKRKSSKKKKSLYTKEQEDEIISKWVPEPLVVEDQDSEDEKDLFLNVWGKVEGRPGKFVEIEGEKYLNLCTHNYLGFVEEKAIDEEAERCIRKYGVGSCGPRGFYGTVDVHLELEEKIAKFMRLEETALYSFGFSTIASAIPSYSKSGDIIFADEYVNFAIQKGIQASRSKVKYFKHNDHEDLKNMLDEQAKFDETFPKKAKTMRRFCIVEGIYMKTGEMCPLNEINELCKKHKVRLIVDEDVSIGTIGENGRGITEHLNVNVEDIDFISGSLENALAAFGGFIVGSSFVVDHQRISGLGYCFSASLPPMLAGAGIQALKLLQENPSYVRTLQENSLFMHKTLGELSAFKVGGHELSPLKFVMLKNSKGTRREDKALLKQVVIYIKENAKIALVQPSLLEKEEVKLIPPCIRIAVNRLLTKEEIQKVGDIFQRASEAFNIL